VPTLNGVRVSRRALVTGTLAVLLALPTSATPVSALVDHQPSAPVGWSVRETHAATRLTWRSTAPIPVADSAVQFWLGRELLGTPRPDPSGRRFTLILDAPLSASPSTLRVTLGGAPIDSSGQRRSLGAGGAQRSISPATTAEPTRVATVDPGEPGRFNTETTEYSLPGVHLTGLPRDVEVQGVVVRPLHTTRPRPLVLFLHGRHSTCFRGGPDGRSSGAWPCPDNWQPIPSYRGYLDAQQLLASQGYVTVSISANGINGQDYRVSDGGAEARSELVRHHLELFDRWNAVGGQPFGSSLVGRVDLNRVMLVGHSRGGEGVNRAAVDSTASDPWRIDSQVLIGPTAFGRQTAPGVDTEVLLPFCDGDVSDLQGQQYIDQARDLFDVGAPDPALRSAVLVMGANHNFFNKEWTPKEAVAPAWDDWGGRDGYCGKRSPTRLTAEQQRNVGGVYIASAARAFVKNDPDALALLDGSNLRPASIGDADLKVTALGANRTPFLTFSQHTDIHSVDAFALICRGYRVSRGQPTCAPRLNQWSQPHFLPMYDAYDAPPTNALRMRWRQRDAKVTVALPTRADLSRSSTLDLRVAVQPGSSRARFDVVIGDGSGQVARLGSQTLKALPGERGLSRLWAQTVRLRLPQGSPLDLSDIAWIRLVGDSREGRIVVLDGFGRTPGISDAPRPTLPRVDVRDVTVKEGDGGEHYEQIVLDVTGPVVGGERFYVQSSNRRGVDAISSVFRLTPGQTTVTVPFAVSGDKRDDYQMRSWVTVKAVRGIVTGHYSGVVTTRDDDPAPNAVIDTPDAVVDEGSPLRWVVHLDHRSDKDIGWLVRPVASGDNELTVSDLPDLFRRKHNLGGYDDDTLLSDTRLRLSAYLRPRHLSTEFTLPIRTDDAAEGPETVTFRQVRPDKTPLPSELSGTVNDAVT
jgi:hypothetical protein